MCVIVSVRILLVLIKIRFKSKKQVRAVINIRVPDFTNESKNWNDKEQAGWRPWSATGPEPLAPTELPLTFSAVSAAGAPRLAAACNADASAATPAAPSLLSRTSSVVSCVLGPQLVSE